MVKCKHNIEYESLKETVDEANEIISELNEENRKLNDKIIDLSADLGMYQNENESLTKDIEKYWQFENQIKLPLNVFSKVLEDFGIVDEEGMGCQITGIGIDGDRSLYWIAVNGDQYDFKDYQKTWWLKGDKDVKEN